MRTDNEVSELLEKTSFNSLTVEKDMTVIKKE